MTLDEAIQHAKEQAQKHRQTEKKYREIHRSENDESLFKEQLEDCIGCAEEHEQLAEWLEELKEYEELEEQGLLLKLPVSLGQEVYRVNNIIIPMTVSKISYTRFFEKIYIETIENKFKGNIMYTVEDIGNNIFLTLEEAEQELKRLECAE